MEPVKRGPGRPKKNYETTGADPVLRDEDGLSPADREAEILTEEEIKTALSNPNKNFIEAGIRLKVIGDSWFMDKEILIAQKRGLPKRKVLRNSGSLEMPLKDVVAAANFLYSQAQSVENMMESVKRHGAQYGGAGEILGKDGEPLGDAA